MNSDLVEQRQFKKSIKNGGFGVIIMSLANYLIDKHQLGSLSRTFSVSI